MPDQSMLSITKLPMHAPCGQSVHKTEYVASLGRIRTTLSCVCKCCDFVPATCPHYMSLLHVASVCTACFVAATWKWKCWQWETSSLLAIYIFSSRFNYKVCLFYCHYFPYLILVFVFKFNCSFGNRYIWRCMLEHTKRQVHKWKFLQHALSRYVYNHSLFVISLEFTATYRKANTFIKILRPYGKWAKNVKL